MILRIVDVAAIFWKVRLENTSRFVLQSRNRTHTQETINRLLNSLTDNAITLDTRNVNVIIQSLLIDITRFIKDSL